jgi:hypothetical protein
VFKPTVVEFEAVNTILRTGGSCVQRRASDKIS